MEFSIKLITSLAAIILTGLSAGFFYAWQVSVIPGTKRVVDQVYLETMQSINRAILNPAFFLIFFGPVALLIIASVFEFNISKLTFALMLGSTLAYVVGTFGVTAFGNVPLNNQLDVMNLASTSGQQLSEFRANYESKWNRLHLIRTAFSVIAFILALLPIVIHIKR